MITLLYLSGKRELAARTGARLGSPFRRALMQLHRAGVLEYDRRPPQAGLPCLARSILLSALDCPTPEGSERKDQPCE